MSGRRRARMKENGPVGKAGAGCATHRLADFAVDARLEDIPAPLAREIKFLLLDHIGCALVGASVDKGRIAVELAESLGGPHQGTIIGAGRKVAAPNAAFANGELMNALDWDVIPHTGPGVIAGALALAERQGTSGAELIVAIAAGYEIASRLAEVLPGDLTPRPHGYGSSIFGALAGAGRALRLDLEQMRHAFGIGGFAAPIPAMTRFEGTEPPIPMTKYISIGWLAQTAVSSALLASLGYRGDTEILDGPEGFWRLFGGDEGRWDPERLIDGLGETWRAPRPWYKRQPCEVLIGVAASRLADIVAAHDLSPQDIDRIHFASLPVLANSCHTAVELATHVDAQFSVPYALALTAHRIAPGPRWQQDSTMSDPGVRRLMERIEVGIHPDARSPEAMKRVASVGELPCLLEVAARGQRFTAGRLEEPRMSEEEIIAKFAKNAETLAPPKADAIQSAVLDLENVDDVSAVMANLAR
jgi:2-methylcitrate dehydratase PrpD